MTAWDVHNMFYKLEKRITFKTARGPHIYVNRNEMSAHSMHIHVHDATVAIVLLFHHHIKLCRCICIYSAFERECLA